MLVQCQSNQRVQQPDLIGCRREGWWQQWYQGFGVEAPFGMSWHRLASCLWSHLGIPLQLLRRFRPLELISLVTNHGYRSKLTHHHAISLSIALRHYRQVLLRSLVCCFESKSNQSFYAMPCEDGDFCACLPWKAPMRATALTRILAFAVLTNDDPIKISSSCFPEWRLSPSEDACWPYISVLLEWLAYAETQPPERNMVRDVFRRASVSMI